jgi:hypothetical protein
LDLSISVNSDTYLFIEGNTVNTIHQLVTKPEDVVKNIKQYWSDLENPVGGQALQRLMNRHQHWYTYEDEEGIWMSPSKWCGYKDMTVEIYLAKYNAEKTDGGLHGKDTETQLKQMSTVLDESDPANERYTDELAKQLWRFGQKRRKGSTISILNGKRPGVR